MAVTVDDIQSEVASIVDQDEDSSAISTDDYSLRLKYMNIAMNRWANLWNWQTLYKQYHMNVSTASANSSIALPSDFRKLLSFPKITYDGAATSDFPEVLPQDDSQYSSDQKRVWILGNPQNGYVLRVFGVDLSSGASVSVPYQRAPASQISPAQIPEVPK